MFDRHLAVWPKHLPLHLPLPDTCFYSNLAISAQRYPHRNAIVYYDTAITYQELKQQVDTLAGYLMANGIERGDRVLLFMQNAPQFIIGFFATLRANAVVVPINPMNKSAELDHYLADTGAKVAIAGQEVAAEILPKVGQHALRTVLVTAYSEYIKEETSLELPAEVTAPVQTFTDKGAVAWSDALAAGHEPGELVVGADDWSVFPYSSGTTGAPKGCVHTHRSMMATTMQGITWRSINAGSVVLGVLPMFHVTGMQSSMTTTITAGGTFVLMTRWNRKVAADLIERYQVSHWVNIVTMAIDLLSDPAINERDLSSLKVIGGGGAAMPSAISDKLFELTGLRYVEGYGLSETMAATHINPVDRIKPQCLGIPAFDVDARIRDQESGELLDVGEVGEIIVSGPQVFQGYWNMPEETEEVFLELEGKRFFRTGDMGYYDEEGYFFIVDRLKRMINASGFKVWPAEVEGLLHSHPDVKQACIISTPHERRGESVKASIILLPNSVGKVTEEDIQQWCRERMATYKVPQVVEFVKELPVSPTGKVLWREMQEQEWAQ
ncbi:MAG TPA: long-chain-fatty-acid--CoA ligase [Alcanivoracaceae bacterium]|nr:long-chain-fatty-acid--CoA ligase [Alcanivoracaceae bacterium]